MKTILIVTAIAIVAAAAGVLIYRGVRAEGHETLSATYKGRKADIMDEERLISLIENYACAGVDRILNQAITNDMVREAGETGLLVSLTCPKAKMLRVSGFDEETQVLKINVLDYERQWLAVYLPEATIVLLLSEVETADIRNCLDIHYDTTE